MNRALIILFVFALMVAGLALAPLRVALDLIGAERSGLSAAGVAGSVWSGRLDDAAFQGVSLGDVSLRLQPLALARGEIRLAAVAEGGAVAGSGTIRKRGALTGFEDVRATAPLSLFRTTLPLSGVLRLEGVGALFSEGRCISAEGRLSTDALQRADGLLGGAGPALTGTARCEAEGLVLPLEGRGPHGTAHLAITAVPDGRYRTVARLIPADDGLVAALRLAGFAPGADGLERREEGRWRR